MHSSPHRYQLDWFVDANGNLLADFIGKFERLDEDWAFVAQKLGLEEKLPHRRENPGRVITLSITLLEQEISLQRSSKWILSGSIMSLPDKIKAIVLTCDRWRAITRHLILKYERLWPDHPFIFMFHTRSFAEPTPTESSTTRRPRTLRGTILHLLADIDDEEWIYWCVDDKYPIQLPTDKVTSLISHAMRSPGIDGLLFCRCRALLSIPALTLHPKKVKNLFGDVYLERKGWWQIWIHQIMRAKVLRHLFKHLPDHIPSAKAMDDLKDDVPKLPEHRLFVTGEKLRSVWRKHPARHDHAKLLRKYRGLGD